MFNDLEYISVYPQMITVVTSDNYYNSIILNALNNVGLDSIVSMLNTQVLVIKMKFTLQSLIR